jgi:predicted Zn-dependent protease
MQARIWGRAARRLLATTLTAALAAALAACATQDINPVTGKPIYAPTSLEKEERSGAEAREELVAQYGVYQNPALTAYVDRVGQSLARFVVRKSVHYTFTILDDDDINAFSLPGGYVYITRGALNFANSEAELAATLGHEIGHIDAFHFHHHDDDPMGPILGVLLRHAGSDAASLAVAKKMEEEASRTAPYSQAQEYEADALGMHYMALAGYDPQGMVATLRSAEAKEKLDIGAMQDNALARDIYDMDQSHPATPDRIARAEAAVKSAATSASVAPVPATAPAPTTAAAPASTPNAPATAGRQSGRDAYLAAIDGMDYGPNPANGTVEGRRLVNAALGFSFEAPTGFNLWTGHDGAFGVGRNAVLVFDTVPAPADPSLATYVQSSIMKEVPVSEVRALDLADGRGATGIARAEIIDVRLAAIQAGGNRIHRLLYVTPHNTFTELDPEFLASLKSFRPLSGAEAKPRPAQHLRIVTVAKGDTIATLAARMGVKDEKQAWFRALNGLADGDTLKPGDKVKLVE